MGFGLLSIATGALNAASTQLQVTGHNIANVNTPGYHRQLAIQQTIAGTQTGAGFIGNGVDIATVQRQYDAFIERQVSTNQAASSADQARATQLTALEQMFSDSTTGIGVSIDSLRQGLADLVNQPSDASTRTIVVKRAGDLATQVRTIDGQLADLSNQTDQQIGNRAGQLNGLLQSLADLNNKLAVSGGSGQPPNDLLDKRDDLISRVNTLIKANSFISADGTVSLFAAGGEALVVNTTASKFDVATDPLDPSKTQLVLKTAGANVVVDGASMGGGELAGLIRFRDQDLAAARDRIGQLAGSLATAFNAQQANGLDASGAAGQPMFLLGAPKASAATTNTGTGQLSVAVANAAALAASDYTVSFDGTDYRITRMSDGQTSAAAALPQTIDGLTISAASGAPAAGDRYLVRAASVMASGFSLALTSGSRLATGMAMMPQPAPGNTGDVAASIFSVDAADANQTAPVAFTFTSAGTFDVTGTGTGNPIGVAYAAGQAITFNGWTVTLDGAPKPGDVVNIVPTASPSTDNRNAKSLIALLDKPLAGGATFSNAYADLLAEVGSRAQSAKTAQTMSSQLLGEARTARDQVGGVNLDEEASRLLQYQQAYQAAAKLIATSKTMFDSLLAAANV